MGANNLSAGLDVLSARTKSRTLLRNILWATDFSPPSEASLSYASALAQRHDAKLYAAHIINVRTDYFGSGVSLTRLHSTEQEIARKMSEIVHSEALRGVACQPAVGLGETTEVLSRMVEDFDVDLMVVGSGGRSGIEKALMGSVAEDIIRLLPVPVLTVGPGVRVNPSGNLEVKRIVCATDFSPASIAAVGLGLRWAEEYSASVVLLHVSEGCAAGGLDADGRLGGALKTQLEVAIPTSESVSCEVEKRVEFGSAAEWILRIAEDTAADLIVLGARKIEVLGGRLPRGTIYKILQKASCPVMTVTDVDHRA